VKKNNKKAKGRYFQDVAFRSEKDDWETPYWIYELLNEYFDFQCDVAANEVNALCDNYFTRENSCLDQEWYCFNYMNPPYGRGMDVYLKKAYEEHIKNDHVTVALVPSRTDTRWFHDYIYKKAEIILIKGRLTFGDSSGKMSNPAPFPSMIVGWGVNPMIFQEIEDKINNRSK